MPNSSQSLPHIRIGKKWIPCLDGNEFGFLGCRYVCDTRTVDRAKGKKLLLREYLYSAEGAAEPDSSAALCLKTISEARNINLRALSVTTYERATRENGKHVKEQCRYYEQDISGLMPLKLAVLKRMREGKPHKVWDLFYTACKALREFEQATSAGDNIPLQIPTSLAVDRDNSIVLLDAELQVSATQTKSGVETVYHYWFGDSGVRRFAIGQEASLLHSRALLRYFRELLNEMQQNARQSERNDLSRLITRIGAAPDSKLDDLEDWIRNNKEDWVIDVGILPDEPDQAQNMDFVFKQPIQKRAKNRSVLLALLAGLNVILVAIIIVLLLTSRTGVAGNNSPQLNEVNTSPEDTGSLLFASYSVAFPTQGTSAAKVGRVLKELFPTKVTEVFLTENERAAKLDEKLTKLVEDMREVDKIHNLLVLLDKKSAIRFHGFTASDPKGALKGIIGRGGIFTITTIDKLQHGSLLQFHGLSNVLKQADSIDQSKAKQLLDELRIAVAEYASFHDALTMIGSRRAFLVQVRPTAVAHEKMRRKILSRLDEPIFISRPVIELFDAVDPSRIESEAFARYSLKLDQECYWRQVSLEDRNNIDHANNTSNDRIKWKPYAAESTISWTPVPVAQTNGRTKNVASFDIAVVGKNIILFRNQLIFLGRSEEEVRLQAESYIRKVLRLKKFPRDAVVVKINGDRANAALNYGLLAQEIGNNEQSVDIEVLGRIEFEQLRKKEG